MKYSKIIPSFQN